MKTDIKTIHISPKKAANMIAASANVVFIDVRSEMEFLFVGHPIGATNIPWIEEPDWDINPNFVRDVRRLVLGGVIDSENIESAPIVLICRSGKRSAQAGEKLIEAGFKRIYNVSSGFEGNLNKNHQRSTKSGWRYDGLPWEQC